MNQQIEQTIVPNEVYTVIMALASKLDGASTVRASTPVKRRRRSI